MANPTTGICTMGMIRIGIDKIKGYFHEVDPDLLNEETASAIFALGLKTALNSKMTSVGPVTKLEGEALEKAHESALAIAERNWAELKAGTFKFPGQAKSKGTFTKAEVTEAKRLVKESMLDRLAAAGYRPSHFKPSQLTAAVKQILESEEGPAFYAKARENLAKRKEVPPATIDLAALGLTPDPEKVAKSAKAKDTAKANLSKAQAGRTAARSKPKAEPGKPDVGNIIAGLATAKVQPRTTAH